MLRRASLLLAVVLAACGRGQLESFAARGDGHGSSGGGSGGAAGTGGAQGVGGGTAGGGAGGQSGAGGGTEGSGGATGGSTDAGSLCDGLDQTTCRHMPGCAADTCFACSCTQAYAGCRPVTTPPIECPAYGCAAPLCCRTQADCAGTGSCVPPGTPMGCGICAPDPQGSCAGDAACPTGQMCRLVGGCNCAGQYQCVAGCTSDGQCDDGEHCDALHHCVAKPCASASDCSASFTCASSQCTRKPCATLDSECDPLGGSSCVEGLCYSGLGECRMPVP